MTQILRIARLENKIRFRAFTDHILAEGKITEEEKSKWKEAKVLFEEKFSSYIPLKENLKIQKEQVFISPEPESLDLEVEAVVMGDVNYIINREGVKLAQGEKLENGFAIKSIKKDRITLAKGKWELTYRIQPSMSLVVFGDNPMSETPQNLSQNQTNNAYVSENPSQNKSKNSVRKRFKNPHKKKKSRGSLKAETETLYAGRTWFRAAD
jgi:hypothetical protein